MFGNIIFPMTGFIEMALECTKTLLHEGMLAYGCKPFFCDMVFPCTIAYFNPVDNLSVRDFVIYEPLALQYETNRELQLVATPSKQEENKFLIEIFSRIAKSGV